jgi:hypothetical protein
MGGVLAISGTVHQHIGMPKRALSEAGVHKIRSQKLNPPKWGNPQYGTGVLCVNGDSKTQLYIDNSLDLIRWSLGESKSAFISIEHCRPT